jgi:hypothetical protein
METTVPSKRRSKTVRRWVEEDDMFKATAVFHIELK